MSMLLELLKKEVAELIDDIDNNGGSCSDDNFEISGDELYDHGQWEIHLVPG